ncbi:MAG TPA: glycosyltransferase family 87 protein [Acidimicrobiia bacterium]|nr:glycosyltransferase family 87 protein [Acidimicrobiia bacterium]
MVRLALAIAVVVVFGILWRRKVRELPPRLRSAADVVEVVALVGLVGVVAVLAYRNVVTPSPWDFPVFYTVGRNAVEGLSFYDPVALLPTFEEIQRTAGVPADWLGDGFGFWYAPQTALVLAPVGVSSYTTGLVLQYLIQGALFVVTIVVVHSAFPLRPGVMGLVEMGVLFFAFGPVIQAFALAQIVFGALLFLALAYTTVVDRPFIAGVLLGVGAVFKHLLVIPAVLLMIMGKARATLGALVAIAASSVVAAAVFGPGVFSEFVTFGPRDRPPEIALDPVIVSLNGFLRRLLDAVPTDGGAVASIMYPPYIVAAALLTGGTAWLVWRGRRDAGTTLLSFSLITLLMLLVYPNTLFNTLPLMIPAMVVLVSMADRLAFPPSVTVAVVTCVYVLTVTDAVPGIVAMILMWTYLALCVARSTDTASTTLAPQVATP